MKLESFPTISGIRVDLRGLLGIAHNCRPGKCELKHSCCASYEVVIEKKEVSRIIGAQPRAAQFATGLKNISGELDNVIEEMERGLYALDTDDDGYCRFAYRRASGAVFCSLHSAALEMGLPPEKVKPSACALWPLSLSEGRPRVLSVQNDAFHFSCNRPRPIPKSRALHRGIADIIRASFGEKFLHALNRQLKACIAK